MAQVRVGLDLVEVAQVEASVARFGDRYLRRIFTDHELSCCQGPPDVAAAGLAARFAAKEAALKVLRPSRARPKLCSIEVRRHADGWCEMTLSGQAAALAKEAGVQSLAVSLTHEGDLAGAVVVALCEEED
jgi:holo-[acyl-carrier protein] synthase